MTNRENYTKAFDNGQQHINAAIVLAEKQHYGFSISHLILGIEELIKYQILFNCSDENTIFTDAEINSIFYNHKGKHKLLKEFQESVSKEFTEDFHEYIFHIASGLELNEKHLSIQKNRFKEWGAFFSVAYPEINIPEADRQSFFKWLNDANSIKNRGFYVCPNGDKWKSPSEVLKEEYETALMYANAILQQTEIMKSLDITEEEFMNYLNSDIPT
jgi:AbiV family abortive infection protein